MSLSDAFRDLYAFGSPDTIRLFKNLKPVFLSGDYLIDEKGIRYKKKDPIAILEVKAGPGVSFTEIDNTTEEIVRLKPRPNAYREVSMESGHRRIMTSQYGRGLKIYREPREVSHTTHLVEFFYLTNPMVPPHVVNQLISNLY